MRAQFLPAFMNLNQPKIPGIWGAWNAKKGAEKEAVSEWPQYEPVDLLSMAVPDQSPVEPLHLANYATLEDGNSNATQPRPAQSETRRIQSNEPYRSLNPDIDQAKDFEIKKVVAKTQETNDNGPMWGVASKPPITFSEDDDFSHDLASGL